MCGGGTFSLSLWRPPKARYNHHKIHGCMVQLDVDSRRYQGKWSTDNLRDAQKSFRFKMVCEGCRSRYLSYRLIIRRTSRIVGRLLSSRSNSDESFHKLPHGPHSSLPFVPSLPLLQFNSHLTFPFFEGCSSF